MSRRDEDVSAATEQVVERDPMFGLLHDVRDAMSGVRLRLDLLVRTELRADQRTSVESARRALAKTVDALDDLGRAMHARHPASFAAQRAPHDSSQAALRRPHPSGSR